jgi:vacuolar-type H+-ATPase subunit I/STV1
MGKAARQSGRLAIFILVVLFILSLSGAVVGFYYFQQERLRSLALDMELDYLKVEKRIIDNKLAEAITRNNDLESQLNTVRTQIEKLSSELEQKEKEKNQLNTQIENLLSQLQEAEKIREELEAQKTQAQDQINKLQALLKVDRDELDTRLSKLSTGEEVELGKIIIGQKQIVGDIPPAEAPYEALPQPQALNALEGEVLVINKDYNFAVVSLGTTDGIKLGDTLSVYHGGSYIGDILIEKTQEAMSACGFKSEGIKDKIKEGDKVIRR